MIEYQLWSKEMSYLHRIGSPGRPVWVNAGFFSTIEEAKIEIERRRLSTDVNGCTELIVEDWKITKVEVISGDKS